jgi:hypothetical protein
MAALGVFACGSSDEGGSSSGSSGSSSSSGSSGATSSSSSGGASGTGSLGEHCESNGDCKESKCVQFTDNDGNERGFCSRVCTKAEDCPEEGWECNLAPYTACVPSGD